MLNVTGIRRATALWTDAAAARVDVSQLDCGARVVDCGVRAVGGLEAGLALAEICLAGRGRVDLVPGRADLWPGPAVSVRTDQPVAACLASQYAGWQIAMGKYFAMGSGPMRAARGREKLFDDLTAEVPGGREPAEAVVGVLETGRLPPDEVARYIAAECQVPPSAVTLFVARTASLAGSLQVVARSVETALHKLHELHFDLGRLVSGFGTAPLPPVAKDDLTGIGRTNDAVLYGGEVTLWVRGDDASLDEIGPRVPSSGSSEHGRPFLEIFERAGRDFYRIDPLLFSPAQVTFVNIDTGRVARFGELAPNVLQASFRP